ncbi:UPF0184 protein CG14818 [Episyrphus balteatus]|uniref:UPF0184 protein CG14818 n=1 Tax=Episyrphus balteatus TaxID=286459 RepID=UPI002484DBDB|nr:UPF0184 protein CG14818 [Episyrphus balteatus]
MENPKSADLLGLEIVEMAPKNENNPNPNKTYEPKNEIQNVVESDLAEFESVNDSLDELSTALDSIEQRTDSIMAELKKLLHSNREIRQSLAEEKTTSGEVNSDSEMK